MCAANLGGSDAGAVAPQIPTVTLEQLGKFKKAKGLLGVQVSERFNESLFTAKCSESSFLGKCKESPFIKKGSMSSLEFNQHQRSGNCGRRQQQMQSGCGADASQMQGGCCADAMRMPCGCRVNAVRMQGGYNAGAVRCVAAEQAE